jgi:integrase
MPRSPPRLYLDEKRKQWVIRDGASFVRTGAGERDRDAAEKRLAQYIAHKHKPEPTGAPLIADVLAVYGEDVAIHKKTARNYGYCINNLLKWWSEKTVADITTKSCRAYTAQRPTMAALGDLKVLKVAVDYWNKEKQPLTVVPTFWRPKGNPPKDRWLTRSEAAQLLRAAKPYRHMRRMILLGLYTGSRSGVILRVRWDQVDLRAGIMQRLPRGATPDSKKRAPPVRLGRRIHAHLSRWKRLDGPDVKYVCHYEGHAPIDPHTSWRKIVAAAELQGVTKHTLRHTRATWMMQRGVPIWEAARFLGMSVKTLEGIYGHHSPDHQERAANI